MSIRTPGVPIAVTVLAILLGLFATVLGVAALVNPHLALGWVPGADRMGIIWGGRNAGLGVVLLVAVVLRSPAGYVVAFAGQLLREVSDILASVQFSGGVLGVLPFLAIDVVGLVFAVRALRRARAVGARRVAGQSA